MSYRHQISASDNDPERLEQISQSAMDAGGVEAFREAINDVYRDNPHNLLLAAWRYRLRRVDEAPLRTRAAPATVATRTTDRARYRSSVLGNL